MGLVKKELPYKYLLVIDLVGIVISFLLATWIRYGKITKELYISDIYGIAFAIILLVYVVIYYIHNSYGEFFKRGYLDEFLNTVKKNSVLAVILTAVMFVFQQGAAYSRLFFGIFIVLNTMITYVLRQYYKVMILSMYKKSSSSTKIMIITTSKQVKNVLARFRKENAWEYQITYLTIIDKPMVGKKIDGILVKAELNNMFEVAKREVLDGIFIHIPDDTTVEFNLEQIILEFENMGLTVNLSINTFGLKLKEKVVQELSGYPVLTFSSQLFSEGQLQLKRILDIAGGFVGCILTMILTIFLAPVIYIESPGPVFFSQTRIGKNGRRFRIYKFRSMFPDAEERLADLMKKNEMNGLMFKMENDPRITKVGKFIRKTSLDEFPQFFNVLKGDMSLVGTRPPTEKEFLLYEGRHKRRLSLKSGLTGLWQVSGRSDITDFEDVVRLDLEYIDNWSLTMDIKILIKTVGVVLFGKGSK